MKMKMSLNLLSQAVAGSKQDKVSKTPGATWRVVVQVNDQFKYGPLNHQRCEEEEDNR